MSQSTLTGAEFKQQLRDGTPKMGLFLNSHSPTVAEQLAHSGYDWLLVDTQHGPMGHEKLSAMLCAHRAAAARSRWSASPAITTAAASSRRSTSAPTACSFPTSTPPRKPARPSAAARYPTAGTRSVYFPQRSTNKAGLLGYVGNANENIIVALQVETASCIKNIDEIAAVPGVDILFLGQNDLCMSMGLYEKYEFPHMYTSPELEAATDKLVERGPQEQRDPRPVPVRHRARRRVPGEGIHVHQHRQRSAPRADAGRRLCEGHGVDREGKRQILDPAAHSPFLIGRSG